MPSASRVIEAVPFHGCGPVGMARTRNIPKCLVIRAACVLIPEYDGQWRPRSIALEYAAQDFRFIRLDARRRALRTALASSNVTCEIFRRERQACLYAVQNHADGEPM